MPPRNRGTNQFNGTALWYNRNPAFAAAPFTLATINRSPPTLKYNQSSIAAGRPGLHSEALQTARNKTFWFAAFEPNWRRDFLAQDALLPTAAETRGGLEQYHRNVVGNPADGRGGQVRPRQHGHRDSFTTSIRW